MYRTDQKYFRARRLGDIARVQPGYLSRTRVEHTATGTHRLLQSRDVSAGEGIDFGSAVPFNPKRNPDLYRVSKGDILIVARGQDHHTYLVQVDLDDMLASSVFHIIRPDREFILPGYLAWWLDQPDAQADIRAGSTGTGIGYVSRQHVEQIPVMLPALDTQQRIAATLALWRRRHALQSQLKKKRLLVIQSLCRQAARQEKEKS